MVDVAGKKLIDHAISSIKKAGINKLIIVTGYKSDNLTDYIVNCYKKSLDLVFIKNDDYEKTNNIYSFYHHLYYHILLSFYSPFLHSAL